MATDEDVSSNAFLLLIRNKYNKLYNTIEEHRYTMCVPATGTGTFTINSLCEEDIESHVFINTVGDIHTINGKTVLVNGKELTTGLGFKATRTVRVLFEESHYNVKSEKFQVLCISEPLQDSTIKKLVAQTA